MSSFAIYLIGIAIVLAGVLFLCHVAHMPQSWTVGLAILVAGAGLIGAVTNTRQRDKP